jgi:predicted nucleotidyltransferase component of viral defense system
VKDHLLSLAASQADTRRRLNLVREYLQAHILRSTQEAGAFAALAFQGGTALRFLYGLRRFSEDLDFALERPEHDRGLRSVAKAVKRDFELSGHDVEVTLRTVRAVHSADLKFPGLLHETGLSSARGAKLMIRVEVDTRPPAGAVTETRLVTRHFPITFRVHDLRSCMAGKIHAVLARRYAKGRDLFDLAWYLTHPDNPAPNLTLLGNALAQTRWKGPEVSSRTWRKILRRRLASLDWPAVVRDVEPFLEDPGDLRLLNRKLLLAELRRDEG